MRKRIVILGSDHVAVSVAGILAEEGNDITLVDENADHLPIHQDRFDIRTVAGHPSYPDVLERADAENADLLIALLPDDDSNLVAAQVAHTLFNIPTKIIRLEAATYIHQTALFSDAAFPVDSIISPQKLVAENIHLLIKYAGAMQVFELADKRLLMVAAAIAPHSDLVGARIADAAEIIDTTPFHIAAAYRQNSLLSDSQARLQAGDEIYCVIEQAGAANLVQAITDAQRECRNVFIGGGGNCGMHLASLLAKSHRVKLIERDAKRAAFLSRMLDDRVIVLRASANDEEMLIQEHIEGCDMFCALTSDDEDNIMAAMLARSLGVGRVLSLVSRPSYVKLVDSMVDIAISPQKHSIGPLLCQTRDSDIVSVCPLRHGASELIEVVAHGAASSSRVAGHTIGDIRWPEKMRVAAVAREDEVLMPRDDIVIKDGDHIVLFVDGRHHIGEIEKLFRVSATFV